MKKTILSGVAASALMCAAVAWVTQDAQEVSAPSPEALARMSPGPMHAKLEALVGSWQMSGKFRMDLHAEWMPFEATLEREWILGGRFLRETVKGEFLGEPFEGLGLIGYDNTREEFTLVWLESVSTGIGSQTGQMRGDTLTFEGSHSDPMSGEKNVWSKSILDLAGAEHGYKGYAKDSNGLEFLNMEMVAERR